MEPPQTTARGLPGVVVSLVGVTRGSRAGTGERSAVFSGFRKCGTYCRFTLVANALALLNTAPGNGADCRPSPRGRRHRHPATAGRSPPPREAGLPALPLLRQPKGRGRKSRGLGRIRRRHVWLGAPLPARGGGSSGRSAAGPSPRISSSLPQRPVRSEVSAVAGRGGGDMSDLGDWFRSIPLITRYWFAGSIAVPLIGKLGLVSPVYLFLWPDAFINRFQIWRPITATFFFPVGPGTGFLYLVNLYFLYQYSSRLETGAFDGRPADYMFMLLFNWICIVITGLAMDMQLLMIPLIMSVLYVWAQLNRDMIVSFWFGTRFKACYLPWVILGFNYIIGGSVINELIGNLVGHLYFFLMFKYPMDLGGRNFLSTPQFLYRWLPNRRGGVSGFGVPPASMRRAAEDQQGGGRHNWGQGFRLGDQ
ncbi:hypothetical protein QYF61_003136 [Mycteria americana]|nr:hypothetical protein QYF61_003136 [Mycteria americana]